MSIQSRLFGLIVSSVLLYVAVITSISIFAPAKTLPDDLLNKWQAVFLSDGQVYFGHLTDENDTFSKLSSVYYLKYGNNLQQATGFPQASSSQNLNLVKLGGEVHGPEDGMYINKDKILFIETLKDSSIVVQAIRKQK